MQENTVKIGVENNSLCLDNPTALQPWRFALSGSA
jgi:hypothetical protein